MLKLKKSKFALVLSGLLCCCMVFCGTAMAASGEESEPSIDNEETVISDSIPEMIARGQMIRNRRAVYNKILDVPYLTQDDSRWANDVMACGKTILYVGCLLTSFTMLHQWLGGIMDPGEINADYGANSDCSFNFQGACRYYGYTTRAVYESGTIANSTAKDIIAASICDYGEPIIVGMRKKSDSTSTHFVVCYGYFSGTYYIHDPYSGRGYTSLDTYLETYNVYRLYSCHS